jgi:8-oxo-dGTP pyrophosphatase MutT (NUDIX family)
MKSSSPNPVIKNKGASRRDLLWRQLYRLAFRLLRGFWFIFRPKGRGSLVAIWVQERLLLVQNSYRGGYNLPGGGCRSGEAARAAAVREIGEEVNIRLFPNQLRRCGTIVSHRNFLRDHCTYFEVHLEKVPSIHIDEREVVDAVFAGPQKWSAFPLNYQLCTYLKRFHKRAAKRLPCQSGRDHRRL